MSSRREECQKDLLINNKLISNSDVAGIGVLLGLTIPALAVFILITIYFLFAVDSRHRSDSSDPTITDVDEGFLKWFRTSKSFKRQDWRLPRLDPEPIEKIILAFSDGQLINAFSLLFSQYIQGYNVDAYHWQILVQCVWFASATHLATIPILKRELRKPRNEPLVYIRATLMTVIWAMLVASIVPTGHSQWLFGSPAGTARPAFCFFDYSFLSKRGDKSMSGFAIIWLGWSIGLVTVTYVRRMLDLLPLKHVFKLWFPSAKEPDWFKDFMTETRRKWKDFEKKHLKDDGLSKFLWVGLKETVLTVWRLLGSFIWHIVWLFMMMSWNLYLLVYNKWYFNPAVDGEKGDNVWSFGQTMPLVLLILPAMAIVEACLDKPGRHHSTTLQRSSWPVYGVVAPAWSLPSSTAGDAVPEEINKTGKMTDPHSTRITVFLIVEFAMLFALLGTVNFVTTVTSAGSIAGAKFVVPFVICLVAAPGVFTYLIHLVDKVMQANNIYEKKDYKYAMFIRSVVAVVVGLGIDAAISFYFIHEFLPWFTETAQLGGITPLPFDYFGGIMGNETGNATVYGL